MNRILDRTMLSGLIGSAKTLSGGIGAIEPVLFTSLGKNPYTTGDMLDKIRTFQTEENEELTARLALVQYEQMLDTLDEAVDGLETQIDDANERVGGSLRKMFINEGFRQSGRNFTKKTLVASTLWKNKYKNHSIEGYRNYRTDIRDLSSEAAPSSESMVEDLGSQGIQALLARAMEGLDEEQQRIFGGESTYIEQKTRKETETYMAKSYTQDGYTWVERTRSYTVIDFDDSLSAEDYQEKQEAWEEFTDKQKQNSRYIELQGGEFNLHVGYAPQFKPDADWEISLSKWKQNVRFEGLGEQGRIIGLYQQHMLIEGSAEAEFEKPFYEQKLWDDRGMSFKAVSLRTVVDIGVTIATSFIAPGSFLAVMGTTALNLADDVLFTFADVGTGYKSAGDAFGALGKKSLTSFATSAINVGFNGLENVDTVNGLVGKMGDFGDNVVGSTLMKGTQIFTTNVATGAINAMDFSAIGSGGFWNRKAFTQGAFGMDAWAGVASGMAGNFMTAGLNSTNLSGYAGDSYRYGAALHSLAGSGASALVEYGMTGSTTLNLLSFSDLFMPFGMDGKMPSTGLLEMRLGGGSPTFTIGMDGYNMGAGALVNSIKGLDIYKQNARIAKSGVDERLTEAMRTLYSANGLGKDDTAMKELYEQLLSGEAEATLGSGQDYSGLTDSTDGTRVIDLNANGQGALDLSVLLAHEAYRDGLDNGELGQLQERNDAVLGHMNVSSQLAAIYGYDSLNGTNSSEAEKFIAAVNSGDMKSAEWKEVADLIGGYDSSADYWRIIRNEDGSLGLMDDGSLDLRDEDGRLLQVYNGEGGLRESLAYHLGLGDSQSAGNSWMAGANWGWVDGVGYVDLATGEAVRNNENHTLTLSSNLESRYNIQHGFVDNVFNNFNGDMVAAMEAAFTQTDSKIASLLNDGKVVPDYLYEQRDRIGAMSDYAETWNQAMGSMWNEQKYNYFSSAAAATAFYTLANNWNANLGTNEHYLYELGEKYNPLGEVVSSKGNSDDLPYFTGKAYYDFEKDKNTKLHITSGGQAADYGTDYENLPIYTTQYESLMIGSRNLLDTGTNDYGYSLTTYNDSFKQLYGHMQTGTVASNLLKSLISDAQTIVSVYFPTSPAFQGSSRSNAAVSSSGINGSASKIW